MGGNGRPQITEADSNRWRTYPTNLLYSGEHLYENNSARGSWGYYWSSTVSLRDGLVGYVELGSGHIYPGSSFGLKTFGHSVRCLAR